MEPSGTKSGEKSLPSGGGRALRREVKMIAQEIALAQVHGALRVHPEGFSPLHPPRTVQSLYLDSPGLDALLENLAGTGPRAKLRLRWYGEARRSVRGQIERKVRHNGIGWKEVLPLPASLLVEGADRAGFVRALCDLLPATWRATLGDRGAEPVQWIAYRREYWTTATGRVRLTLDTHLRAWDQRLRATLGADCPAPLPRVCIVECKAALEDDRELEEALQDLPLLPDKCSKYVLAASPCDAPLVSILAE